MHASQDIIPESLISTLNDSPPSMHQFRQMNNFHTPPSIQNFKPILHKYASTEFTPSNFRPQNFYETFDHQHVYNPQIRTPFII